MTCPKCGNEIVFIKRESKSPLPCEPGIRSFRVVRNCGHAFLNMSGKLTPGVPDDNGDVKGHLIHWEVCGHAQTSPS